MVRCYDPLLVGVPPLVEHEWSEVMGWPQLGQFGGGGKLLCMIPIANEASS